MKKGERARIRRRRTLRRVVLTASLLVLVAALSIGGTIAWLTADTTPVVNTFTASDINIELTETEGGEDHEFKMVPGKEIAKDPKVTVKADSEACWLFVKVEASDNFDDFLGTYSTANGWNELTSAASSDGLTKVYYREVESKTTDQPFYLLKDADSSTVAVGQNGSLKVLDTVDKDDMAELKEPADYPTLTFTAYACQSEGRTIEQAAVELKLMSEPAA